VGEAGGIREVKSSPTQRSLAELRKRGYRCAVVEKWNGHIQRRQDLFGVVDVLAIKEGETLAVQTTSGSNVSARVAKIAEAEATPDMRAAGWKIVVHGWRKNSSGRYVLREVDVS
jgi:predicted RecB family endonuclease